MSVIESTAAKPKRVKAKALGHGLGTVYQYTNADGSIRFGHRHINPTTGKQVEPRLSARTKTEALREASARLEKIERGEIAAPSRMTFDEMAKQCDAAFEAKVKSGQRSGRTLEDYEGRYGRVPGPGRRFGKRKAQSITRAEALRYHDDLLAACESTATSDAYWKTFVRIVNFGNERGLISLNVTLPKGDRVKVTNKRKVRIPTADESNRIINKMQEDWRTLVKTVRGTGARVSEPLGLQVQDVDFSTGVISITKQLDRQGHLVPPKTENGVRTIHISESLRMALLEHYNGLEDKSPTAFLFGQHTQPKGRYRLAARALAKAIKDAEIEYDPTKERISFHSFRHAAASQLVRQNIDPQRIADHLGDSVQVVIDTYVHSVETDEDQNLGELLAVAS